MWEGQDALWERGEGGKEEEGREEERKREEEGQREGEREGERDCEPEGEAPFVLYEFRVLLCVEEPTHCTSVKEHGCAQAQPS